VKTGTVQFEQRNFRDALRLYQLAMELKPDRDEARAATYNAACAHVQLRQWQEAADAVKAAVNEYGLKVEVAQKVRSVAGWRYWGVGVPQWSAPLHPPSRFQPLLLPNPSQDPDLRPLRERREWLDAQDDLAGVVARETRLSLRSEARAPFRLARTTLLGGLAAGAGLGLLIIATRLAAALAGAPGAPALQETAGNFGVNAGALALLVFLLRRDLRSKSRDEERVDREEKLARLQVGGVRCAGGECGHGCKPWPSWA